MINLGGSQRPVEEFPDYLHEVAIYHLSERDIDEEQLAEMLDIFPEGAKRLLNQRYWPASTGFRVLEALGVEVDVTIS